MRPMVNSTGLFAFPAWDRFEKKASDRKRSLRRVLVSQPEPRKSAAMASTRESGGEA